MRKFKNKPEKFLLAFYFTSRVAENDSTFLLYYILKNTGLMSGSHLII